MGRSGLVIWLIASSACAQVLGIEDTVEMTLPSAALDAGPQPEWAVETCPVIAVYVTHWQIDSLTPEFALRRFMVVINQSDEPSELSNLYVSYIGDTHNAVEIEAAVEPWIGEDFWIEPRTQLGALSVLSADVLSELLVQPPTGAETILSFDISSWDRVDETLVSIEVILSTSNDSWFPLQVRFEPGVETRPLTGSFVCMR